MPFSQTVEVGRLALVVYGELVDNLVVIVDIVDDKQVIIDIIGNKDSRQKISLERLKLTDFVAKIDKNAAPEAVQSAAVDVAKLWEESAWGKEFLAKKNAASLSDFQRFKHDQLEKKREELIEKELAKN